MNLRTVGYYGGKNPRNGGSGRWVASMLPVDMNSTYCEPFCGLLGVLIQRPRVKVEVVNDLNHRLTNFLRCVRDEPEELGHRIHYTPHSDEDFDYAVAHIDDPDLTPIERAWCFYVVVNFSIMHGDERAHIGWRWHSDTAYGTPRLRYPDVVRLSERITGLQIHTCDAVDIIERVAIMPNSLIYADPPYPSSDRSVYLHSDIDQDRLCEAFRACKGQVAISGYGDEWDRLGWHRSEYSTTTNKWRGVEKGKPHMPRTEVLWTNYPPAQRRLL